jgi:transposase-like protein
MMYIRYPLCPRQVEDLLFERGIDICHETMRFWWNRFGPLFAAEIRKRRLHHRSYACWRWRLDEIFVRINGKTHYLWRAVDHEGEVLEDFATKRRDRKAALAFLKRAMKRSALPCSIVTDRHLNNRDTFKKARSTARTARSTSPYAKQARVAPERPLVLKHLWLRSVRWTNRRNMRLTDRYGAVFVPTRNKAMFLQFRHEFGHIVDGFRVQVEFEAICHAHAEF